MDVQDALAELEREGIVITDLREGSMLARIGGDRLPFDISVVLEPVSERKETYRIVGLDRLPTLSQWKLLNKAAKKLGVHHIIIERARLQAGAPLSQASVESWPKDL